MPDVTASYGIPFDFIVFFGYFHTSFMSELLYLHQTITLCVQPVHFDTSTHRSNHLWSLRCQDVFILRYITKFVLTVSQYLKLEKFELHLTYTIIAVFFNIQFMAKSKENQIKL